MNGYSTKIEYASKELTKKEQVMLKDTSDCTKLDEALNEGSIIINPDFYAVIAVHNEKSDNNDYKVYVVVDKDGSKYVTGSDSFFTSFEDIVVDMTGSNEEWAVKVYKLESKNYKGKKFITCSIV